MNSLIKNNLITKAVIPIAGFGTRFLPATKAVPKAMFPIIDVPAVHYLVEEAIEAGCKEIIFVLNRQQEIIKTYFHEHEELSAVLLQKNKSDLISRLRKIMDAVEFHFAYQEAALGDGHAILCAQEFIKNEPFLVLFGDDLVDPPVGADLVQMFNETSSPIIAIEQIPSERVSQYGIVDPSEIDGTKCQIKGVVEKPKIAEAPSNLGIVGKYVCTPKILQILANHPQSADGEIRLVEAFKEHLKTNSVYGYIFPGKRYDIGHKFGLIEATIDFALQRPELSGKVRSYLKTKVTNS